MRVAVCFSGQPRFVSECSDRIKNNIIEANSNHDIDFFVHTWFSEEICNKNLYVNEFSSFSGNATIPLDCLDRINTLYKPKKMSVDSPKNFKPSNFIYENFIKFALKGKSDFGMPVEVFQIKKAEGMYSMMYSLMQSITLKKLYELENGFKYDLVVKMRFDNIINYPIYFESIEQNIFYSQFNNNTSFEICDWINISNSEIMDKFGCIFLELDKYFNYSISSFGGWSPESILKSCCLLNYFTHKTLDFKTSLPAWGIIK